MGRARQGTTTTTSQAMSSDQLESVCYEHDGASVPVCRHENSEDITHIIRIR